jgi:hypothetical protein
MNDDNPPYSTYGFLDVEIKNKDHTLVRKFYSNDEQENEKYVDYFTITKIYLQPPSAASPAGCNNIVVSWSVKAWRARKANMIYLVFG